jgi:hypothetical protein
MDLKQRKLSKSEWESIEIPVAKNEIEILQLIKNGYSNVNIKINKTDSLFTYLKIEYSTQIEEFLYAKYFADKIKSIVSKHNIKFIVFGSKQQSSSNDVCYVNVSPIVRLNSGDQIRLSRLENLDENNTNIYENVLYKNLEDMITCKNSGNPLWMFYYYTLSKLLQNSVDKVNCHLLNIIKCFIHNYENDINLLHILQNSYTYIERNVNLFKYSDLHLYDHQKELFTAVKSPQSKLILYIAPTGTGKTLSPLGISETHKVIFVCAARHVGLALARSAISINKKIAFAFGCSSAEDIRLHYFSAKVYTRDRKSGSIRKVDNSVGDKVEIIICDIRSYLPAMYYMLAFNSAQNIVTYWDEPTITLDYDSHDLHKIIKKNWKQNIIPNFVLSSATLPKIHELTQTISDFHEKFSDSTVYNIVSHDCRKTIPLINNNGYVVMPHYFSSDYNIVKNVVANCEDNLTLLRYFDLKESADFINYIEDNNYCRASSNFSRNFASVNDIDMTSIKIHYLKVLKNIVPERWSIIYSYCNSIRVKRIQPNSWVDTKGKPIIKSASVGPGSNSISSSSMSCSGQPLSRLNSTPITISPVIENTGSAGIYVTTNDAYTLTDGPTIFLATDLQKIAKFCIQQSNIPASVMNDINEKIVYNNQINEKINEFEDQLELEEEKISKKLEGQSGDTGKGPSKQDKKNNKSKSKIANNLVNKTDDKTIATLRESINTLKTMIKRASLNDMFIPNKLHHLEKWVKGINTTRSFTSDIDDGTIVSIMLLQDVEDSWKVLLLLGIGVFTEHKSSAYTEIMKKLADTQKLYLIIADSDYIYGTNYQFCHGYLSKDLVLTQEKIIQALGRIGRNNIQQEYSARFRDDSQVEMLFKKVDSDSKPEVINMNILFNCRNVQWNGTNFEELPDIEVEVADNEELEASSSDQDTVNELELEEEDA